MSEVPEPGWGGTPQPSVPPPTDPYGQQGPGMRPDSGAYHPGYPGAVPQRTSGLAIAAFGVSLASWVVAPVIGAIAALVLAHYANDEIRRSAGQVGGDWMVVAARIISWIQLALALLAFLFVLVVIGIIGSGLQFG